MNLELNNIIFALFLLPHCFSRNFTFTGWADPALIEIGVREMEHASRLLIEAGYEPDLIYTSRLKRAIQGKYGYTTNIRCHKTRIIHRNSLTHLLFMSYT